MKNSLLKDKVVIVVGGCGLLGKAFVNDIIENKGICIIADKDSTEGINQQRNIAESYNNAVIEFISCDLSQVNSISDVVNKTHTKFKKIDAFVNVSYPRNENWGKYLFDNLPIEDFNENMSLHLGGYFQAAQIICNYFKKQGYGNIIQVASIQGVQAPKFDTYKDIYINSQQMSSPVEYSIFKAGIIHFTRYLAKYFKGHNIRSNCISPGGIRDNQPIEFMERYKSHCLTKGMLDPQDISGTLVYLLSDLSKYVNGQNIIVDDGWTL